MNHYRQPNTFLFVAREIQDANRLDAAILDKKLDCQKLSDLAYLGFFFDNLNVIHAEFRANFGIKGEIHWIQLPSSEITK